MMTPASMCKVRISLLTENLAQAGLELARTGSFAPHPVEEKEGDFPETPLSDYLSAYESARIRFRKICQFLQFTPDLREIPEQVPQLAELEALDQWLEEIWQHCSACAENLRKGEEELREVHQLQDLLRGYRHLDIDLGLLQSDFRFLHVRLGTVPQQNLKRLGEAVALAGFALTRFAVREERAHVIVAGLKEHADQLETVLKAADFRGLTLPEEFSDHPAEVERTLEERENRILQQRQHLHKEIRLRREEHGKRLQEAALKLYAASGFAHFGETPGSRGGLALVTGWVPESELETLKRQLHDKLDSPVMIESRAPTLEETPQVPSCLKHGRWLRPFAALVRNYGIPRYREIDPTWFLTISFGIMFGMMFGDIGHGALFVLAGFLIRRRYPQVQVLLTFAGIFSMLFGLLYGSVFGYEHLIPALWISPLEDPVLMLKVAFAWGVLFIVVGTLMRIRNDLVEGLWQQALFDSHGLAGLFLYLALLAAGWYWVVKGTITTAHQLALLLPLLALLGWKWRQLQAPPGEKALVVLIEGFETFMNYISNTLSFLRVAAFGLNHVALALAVFALANMLDTTGHWITVILGNLFIVILEGAIVVIQVLRLEYYEGFSRFFRGDGRPFEPLKLSLETTGGESPLR